MFIAGCLRIHNATGTGVNLHAVVATMANALKNRKKECFYRNTADICLVDNHEHIISNDLDLAYAGQFFNLFELKRELLLQEDVADDDVLKSAYKKWGVDFVKHVKGEFVLALYDLQTGCLLLARDRVGMRPLYYAQDGGMLLFGSEVKALLQATRSRDINYTSLHGNLLLHSVYTREHLFEGIRELRAGHWLTAWSKDGRVDIGQYWDREFNIIYRSQIDYEEGFKRVLNEAVCKRLPSSGNRVGISLSGGVDSTVVAALAREQGAGVLDTYTVVAQGDPDSEGSDARLVARHLNSCHHEISVSSRQAFESIPQVIYHMGEVTSSFVFMNIAIQTFFVGKTAAENGCTTIFTGNGVEHNFDGNDPQRALNQYWDRSKRYPRFLRNYVLPALLPYRIKRMIERRLFYPWSDKEGGRIGERYIMFNSPWPWGREAWLKAYYTATMRKRLGDYEAGVVFLEYQRDCKAGDYFNKLLYLDFKTWNSRRNLVTNERLLSNFGVEMQIPFLDADVVAFSSSIPVADKYRVHDSKYFLRKLYKGTPVLPQSIFEKGKQNSIPNFNYWTGDMLEVMRHFAQGLRKRDIFDRKHIDRVIKAGHKMNRWDRRLVFSFFVLELWFRIYVDRLEVTDSQLTLEYLSR